MFHPGCYVRLSRRPASTPLVRPSLSSARSTPLSKGSVDDRIPPHTLMEKSPADRVDLQKEIGNRKALIMYSLPVTCANSPSGTPAAFSGTCSEQHLPGFFSKLSQLRDKGIQEVFVISANDPFVMNAWKKSLGGDPSVSPQPAQRNQRG